ncbi:hypothetical protein CBER1_06718 [Cercospora berteroae]|uniref:Glycerate kinase n=1 Tax=Cercospora berteroae TaxID=357750 RepID=A0A2S6CN95_9PEZI|nr:hypothetical protein CBER1_06718 [Cercospora berteroae]
MIITRQLDDQPSLPTTFVNAFTVAYSNAKSTCRSQYQQPQPQQPTTSFSATMGAQNIPAVSERVMLGNQIAENGPRILICPSGFKESLGPNEVADCIEAGVLRAVPTAKVMKAPMVDGGEGFTEALVATTGGQRRFLEVTGPVRETVPSHYGFLGNTLTPTAVVEMAAAAGLSIVPRDQRNPLYTTTFGVGQLIKAALDDGAMNILLGCGDSGTCDGGIGMAQALGARFFTTKGTEIPPAQGGASLTDLAAVDLSGLHPRLQECSIDVACNWHNVLCGPKGVARVFGPQKGATPTEVELLDMAMIRVGTVVSDAIGKDITYAPGSGASGGMGAGLQLIGAQLHPRFDIITKFLNINSLVKDCDVVITAEGGIDEQTPRGKIPAEVARIAKSRGVPVIALAGTVGKGASCNYEAGIDAYASILQAPVTLQVAIEEAERLLTDAAESVTRMVMVGCSLKRFRAPSPLPPTGPAMAFKRSRTFYY